MATRTIIMGPAAMCMRIRSEGFVVRIQFGVVLTPL
jgi:hypothetical protein